MENYVEALKDYLQGRRNMTRNVYSIASTLYRAITKNRISYERGEEIIKNMKIKEEEV